MPSGVSDGVHNYEYSANNMLKLVRDTASGSPVEQYWYNPAGERVRKVIYLAGSGNQTTYFV